MDKVFTLRETLKLLNISKGVLARQIEIGLVKPMKAGPVTLFTEGQLKILTDRFRRTR